MALPSIPDQELRANVLLWYLVEKCRWYPERSYENGTYKGFCLFHQERTPSMTYYPPPDEHVQCFGGGCGIHADLPRLIGMKEFALFHPDPLTREVFLARDALLAEFVDNGGAIGETIGRQMSSATAQVRRVLSLPGPLHRKALTAMTTWWHEQLLAENANAQRARNYLIEQRGVAPFVVKECPVVGYMPRSEDLHWRIGNQFDNLFHVTKAQLAEEREWYRQKIPWETLTPDHLAFLASEQAFRVRLGAYTQSGRWRLADRLLFSCQNARRETRFYQGRLLDWFLNAAMNKRSKFLNPPGIIKYPYQVVFPMIESLREAEPLLPGTLKTESPFGPLVACSHHLCRRAFAVLGESTPVWEYLMGLEEPIWLADDNDNAHQDNDSGPISYPGEKQAQTYAAFFAEKGVWAERLLPWRQYKGVDEWLHGTGGQPVVATMQQILHRKVDG